MSEATDALVGIVHALDNTSAIEVVDFNLLLLATLALEDKLGNAWLISTKFHTLIYIAVGMTSNGDWLLPVFHTRVNAWDGDRSTEHRTVHDAADGAVWALPHLVQMIFLHTLSIRSDSSALHCHTIFLSRLSGVDGHLVIGLVTVRQTKVIIL